MTFSRENQCSPFQAISGGQDALHCKALFSIGLPSHSEDDGFFARSGGNGIEQDRVGKDFAQVLDRKAGDDEVREDFDVLINSVYIS